MAVPGKYQFQRFDSEFNTSTQYRSLAFDKTELRRIAGDASNPDIEIMDVRVGGTGYLPMQTYGQLGAGYQGFVADNIYGFQLPSFAALSDILIDRLIWPV